MQQTETVVKFLNAFSKKKVTLTKVKKVSGHSHSQPMEVGTKITGELSYFPKEGQSFNIEKASVAQDGRPYEQKKFDLWCTSIVIRFLPDNMFETKNSIYQYQILN